MLLTGFESYGGRSLNPSEQVVKRLAGAEIGGARVIGHTLPVRDAELGAAHPAAVRCSPVGCLPQTAVPTSISVWFLARRSSTVTEQRSRRLFE